MAGTILISSGIGFPVSTIEFDYLVEKIRSAFPKEAESSMAQIYEPMDEGGMTFISLVDVDGEAFREFLHATEMARSVAEGESNFPLHEDIWNELLQILQNDSRSNN